MPNKRRRSPSADNKERDSVVPTAATTAANPGLFARLRARAMAAKRAIAAVAAVGAVLGGLAGYWTAYRAAKDTVLPPLITTVGTGDAGPLSIAILPFKNLTGESSQAHIADGITSAITTDVARIRDVFVISTATAFAYRDRTITAQQIGRELGVRFLLTGGIQRNGDRILISVQLADTATAAHLWAETFDGSQSNFIALQESVTARIANSIGQETLKAAARTSELKADNPRVLDLTLRARAIRLTKAPSPQAYRDAILLYRQAAAIDPNDLEVQLGLATTLAVSADNGFATNSAEGESQLREAGALVEAVRGRVQEDANIFLVLSILAASRGDFEGAKRADEAALALEPKSPARFANLADTYLYAGQPERALGLLEQAIRLYPRSPHVGVLINMGVTQLMLGQESAAVDWLLKAKDASPQVAIANVYLAAAYARLGQMDQARAAAAEALRISPDMRRVEFAPPRAGYPVAYREFWESKLLPALQKAGLPG